jgi:glycosyltransferase involved in cell wall biosynthesis
VNAQFQQYWAHSHWIAKQATASGVDPDRIRVVPHGVDPLVFRPDGIRYEVPSNKGFAFLFVGGISFRKGTDTLLAAYRKAFSSSDDVVLVLKDNSRDLFYRDDTIRGSLASLKADHDAPEVVHIDGFLPEEDLVALYRACDVAVFPYRAEGLLPPGVHGLWHAGDRAALRACLDFCSDGTSYFVEADEYTRQCTGA